MIIPEFEYVSPQSVQEACALLVQYGDSARVLAGGSDLLVKMKDGLMKPAYLVSLKNLDSLKAIRYETGTGVIIGARATHNEVMNNRLLQEKYRSVCEAAHSMAADQIRNIGTVGGNLVNAVPSADLPPILIALDARARIVGSSGERTIALEDFFLGPGKTVLEKGEILAAIIIPDQPTTGSNYIKFGLRRAGALAVAGVASSVTVSDGTCRDVRVVLGAVAPTPMRARQAENVLRGKKISRELIDETGRIAAAESKPISDIRGSIEYRRNLVNVLTRRSLKAAIEKGHI
ncbi:MAG: carbon monoxide dehydrogenase [Deltaproteobacteria bacterium RIFCSPLOWO2_02_56_12]|nr:MAG: carbon monoxide dehydrogenase [Deltaproteobacteria bacterium RIFCSPLOWO2_02_56_12]